MTIIRNTKETPPDHGQAAGGEKKNIFEYRFKVNLDDFAYNVKPSGDTIQGKRI